MNYRFCSSMEKKESTKNGFIEMLKIKWTFDDSIKLFRTHLLASIWAHGLMSFVNTMFADTF